MFGCEFCLVISFAFYVCSMLCIGCVVQLQLYTNACMCVCVLTLYWDSLLYAGIVCVLYYLHLEIAVHVWPVVYCHWHMFIHLKSELVITGVIACLRCYWLACLLWTWLYYCRVTCMVLLLACFIDRVFDWLHMCWLVGWCAGWTTECFVYK